MKGSPAQARVIFRSIDNGRGVPCVVDYSLEADSHCKIE
jgi:hypothetical protein